jgi:hypothetical protein
MHLLNYYTLSYGRMFTLDQSWLVQLMLGWTSFILGPAKTDVVSYNSVHAPEGRAVLFLG